MFVSCRNSFNEEADLLTSLHKGTFPTTWGHHGNHFSFCLSSVAFQVRNFKVLFLLFFLMSRSSFFYIPWCWYFHASSVLMDMGMCPIPMGTGTSPQSVTCDCWMRLPVISVFFFPVINTVLLQLLFVSFITSPRRLYRGFETGEGDPKDHRPHLPLCELLWPINKSLLPLPPSDSWRPRECDSSHLRKNVRMVFWGSRKFLSQQLSGGGCSSFSN